MKYYMTLKKKAELLYEIKEKKHLRTLHGIQEYELIDNAYQEMNLSKSWILVSNQRV